MLEIHPSVIEFKLTRERISESEGFIQVYADLIGNCTLSAFEYFIKEEGIVRYRYQVMTKQKQLVARWDNLPHFAQLSTFPHHFHTPDGVFESDAPTLDQVLDLFLNFT
ncbi:MAG TPA: DUF6516 family protein [Candidatus Lokiarchaeia archaeon]|nr:DUF6516 family protein [Candidatus Lokiarchaeia archaeon]